MKIKLLCCQPDYFYILPVAYFDSENTIASDVIELQKMSQGYKCRPKLSFVVMLISLLQKHSASHKV